MTPVVSAVSALLPPSEFPNVKTEERQVIVETFSFSSLPDELKLLCLADLSHSELLNVRTVCKEWNQLIPDQSLWKIFIEKMGLHCNTMKNQKVDSERMTYTEKQDACKNQNSETKPTQTTTDYLGCFNINSQDCNAIFLQAKQHCSVLDDSTTKASIIEEVKLLLSSDQTALYSQEAIDKHHFFMWAIAVEVGVPELIDLLIKTGHKPPPDVLELAARLKAILVPGSVLSPVEKSLSVIRVDYKNLEILKMLIEAADPHPRLLHTAVEAGVSADTIGKWIAKGMTFTPSDLITAVSRGEKASLQIIQMIIDTGIAPQQHIPAHYPVIADLLTIAVLNKVSEEILSTLLEAGFPIPCDIFESAAKVNAPASTWQILKNAGA